jgi:hypothetical protein
MKQNCDYGAMGCGRRTFVASLTVASKYSQDVNFGISSWSKISGLCETELRQNELEFLKLINWQVHVPCEVYENWCTQRFLSGHCQIYDSANLVSSKPTNRQAGKQIISIESLLLTPPNTPDTYMGVNQKRAFDTTDHLALEDTKKRSKLYGRGCCYIKFKITIPYTTR